MATRKQTNSHSPAEISGQQLLDALLDEVTPLAPRFLYRLSDLEGEDERLLRENWGKIALWRRQALMEDLPVLAEEDYLLSFDAVGRIAVQDPDSQVRFGGIQAFIASECESPDLIKILLSLAETDPDANVRAAAVSALGKFIYMGELDMISEADRTDLENRLIELAEKDAQAEVRRNALESLGFSGREEVYKLINRAYQSKDQAWVASALFAMGRSADESWSEMILAHLEDQRDPVRLEAVRAAGELYLKEARTVLIATLDDPNEEIRLAAIWSLSQIGGQGLAELLAAMLKKASDDEEIIFIEQALDNLAFNSDVEDGLGMFYIPDPSTDPKEAQETLWDDLDEDLEEPESLYFDSEDDEFDEFEEYEEFEGEEHSHQHRSLDDLIYIEDDMDDDEESED